VAGKYFEELAIGQTFRPPARTHGDRGGQCVVLLPDHESSIAPRRLSCRAKAEFGKPLVNSLSRSAWPSASRSARRRSARTVGNLGFEKVEFPKPVFHGDTIYSETEVVDKRESRSRPQWGIVTFVHRALNQHARS